MKISLPLKLKSETRAILVWPVGEGSWQKTLLPGCLLTGKCVGTQSYVYFPKQQTETRERIC